MNSKERASAVFASIQPDRPPSLGGWIASPMSLIQIAGSTTDEYNHNPQEVAIKAYKALGIDALIDIFVTKSTEDYRHTDIHTYAKADKGISYEEAERMVEELPKPEEYEKSFDFEGKYLEFKYNLLDTQAKCGDMVYMPANWAAGARAAWFFDYGYENFFLLVGLRPDLCEKLFKIGGAMGRCQSTLVAKAVQEGIFPKALLMGEDLCSQRGPLISEKFLETYYAPALEYGLEPLLEVGCRPVWHSDGDVRLLIPMLLKCGIQGFQGFQPECGMRIEEIVKLRTREGNKLLIFGPMAVTTELPVLSASEVRNRVRSYIEICKDEVDLMFFTSNTINPDISVENIVAMYDEVRNHSF